MARTRTTKKLAQRIDLNYFKKPTPLKRAKFWLSLALLLLALFWIAEKSLFRDSRVYSSGRLSRAHAVLEKECSACHVSQAGAFSAKAADSACLGCHDGPVHHPGATKQLQCSDCHVEHRGGLSLAALSSEACAECHSDLRIQDQPYRRFPSIRTFEDGHPDFRSLEPPLSSMMTLKLSHALHMRPIRSTPTGLMVHLDCGDCHRPAAVKADWPYADQKYVAASPTYTDDFVSTTVIYPDTIQDSRPMNGRELMAPVRFASACAACHLLTFDRRFAEGVPHDKPEVVHRFLVKRYTEYIAVHATDLREVQDPDRNLAGRPLTTRARTLQPPEWITEQTALAEKLLWHKTCAQCHEMMVLTNSPNCRNSTVATGPASNFSRADSVSAGNESCLIPLSNASQQPDASILPVVASAGVIRRWFQHAKFDHDAHRGFSCVNCHAKALTSTESSDILLPGIATCKTCHAPGPGHADSRCSECHTYHDWSKRKEVTPKFTLPALRTGGQ